MCKCSFGTAFSDEESADDCEVIVNPWPEDDDDDDDCRSSYTEEEVQQWEGGKELEWDQQKEMAKYGTQDPVYAHYRKQVDAGKTDAMTYEGYLAMGMHLYSKSGVSANREGREEFWWDVMPYYSWVSGTFFPQPLPEVKNKKL